MLASDLSILLMATTIGTLKEKSMKEKRMNRRLMKILITFCSQG